MAMFNIEITGSILLIFVLVRTNFVSSWPHRFINGLRIFLPPTESDLERIQPPKHKRAKTPPKQKSVEERLALLNIMHVPITQNFMINEIFYQTYEKMILVALSALLTLAYTVIYRCFFADPAARPAEWLTATCAVCAAGGLYCGGAVLRVTGRGSAEGSFGFSLFYVATLLAAMMLFSPAADIVVFTTSFEGILLDLHERMVVCWGMLFHGSFPLSAKAVDAGVRALLAVLGGAAAAACSLPAMRFGHTFDDRMQYKNDRRVQALLWAGLALPLLVCVAWNRPALEPLAAAAGLGEGGFRAGQLALLALFTGVYFGTARTHLQMFLETAVRSISVDLEKREIDKSAVDQKFKVRIGYLMMAATQYVAPGCVFLGALLLLVAKSAPRPGGCVLTGLLEVCRLDAVLLNTDTTPRDFEMFTPEAAAPTLRDLLGQRGGAGEGEGAGLTDRVLAFARQFSDYVVLTDEFWRQIGNFIVFWSTLWHFILYSSWIAFWRIYPDRYEGQSGASSRQEPTPAERRAQERLMKRLTKKSKQQ